MNKMQWKKYSKLVKFSLFQCTIIDCTNFKSSQFKNFGFGVLVDFRCVCFVEATFFETARFFFVLVSLSTPFFRFCCLKIEADAESDDANTALKMIIDYDTRIRL